MSTIHKYIKWQDKDTIIKEYLKIQSNYSPWKEFLDHNTVGEVVRVFALRASGKTTNIIKKILETPDVDTFIWIISSWCQSNYFIERIFQENKASGRSLIVQRNGSKIIIDNQKTVYFVASSNLHLLRGLRFDNLMIFMEDVHDLEINEVKYFFNQYFPIESTIYSLESMHSLGNVSNKEYTEDFRCIVINSQENCTFI